MVQKERYLKEIMKIKLKQKTRTAIFVICKHNSNNFYFDTQIQITNLQLLYHFSNHLDVHKNVKSVVSNMADKNRFDTVRLNNIIDKYELQDYLTNLCKNEIELCNIIYKNKGGNNQDGDGWLYRPRGLVDLTYKDNYRLFGLHANPDSINNDFDNNINLLLKYCEYNNISDNDNFTTILNKFKINEGLHQILFDEFNEIDNRRII